MLIYIFKSAACMAIFLLFYKLLLEKESMHVFKRFYLMLALIAALIIPGLVFIEYVEPIVTTYTNTNSFIETSTPVLVGLPARDIDVVNWPLVALTIYGIGALIFGIRFLKNLVQIVHRIRRNTKVKQGFSIKVLLLEQLPPHTFFKYIFLNKEKFETNTIPKEVLLHEEIHAKQRHSIDVVFVELLQVILWFNPLLYFFKKSIKLNHEFLADSAVIAKDISTSNYQNTLLSYLSQDSLHKYQSVKMANAINYSSIKKRFKVMKNKTSKKAILLRSLLLLPLLALMLYGFSETKTIAKQVETNNLENTVYSSQNTTENFSEREVELAGLILDNETLLPLENVEIYDSAGNFLSKTNKKGFYNTTITVASEGEIRFNLTAKKTGYKPFIQNEHWGNLANKSQASLFMGLQKNRSDTPVFSELFINVTDLSTSTIEHNLKRVKDRLDFETKIAEAKKGNQNIFFEVSDEFYIINDFGWIKLKSVNDIISINGKQNVTAHKLNSLLSRRDITGMTPITNSEAEFAIYTIPIDDAVRPSNKINQKQILKFNILSKKYNAVSIENRIIPLEDLKILESIYRKMSIEQKEKAQPFPECLPKNIQKGASREQMAKYNSLARKYNEMDSDNMRILMKDVEQLKYIYSIMSDKQKADAEPFPDFPEPPPAPDVPNHVEAPNPPESSKVKKGKVSSVPPPPPPPKPIEPLDHIIKMAKKGATFYYEGKEISSDKAIDLFKKRKDLNISTSKSNSKNPQVSISKEPIKIGAMIKKEGELLKYARELEKKNALFYIDNKYVNSKKALSLISKKDYDRVETFPYTSKTPEVRIYTKPLKQLKSNGINLETGNIKVNGKELFYSTKNGITNYFNKEGQQVDKQGKLFSKEQKQNPTFYFNGEKISSTKAHQLLKNNRSIQVATETYTEDEYAIVLADLSKPSYHKNNNKNTNPNSVIDLTEMIEKEALFFFNDEPISVEKALWLTKNEHIDRVNNVGSKTGKPKVYLWKKV